MTKLLPGAAGMLGAGAAGMLPAGRCGAGPEGRTRSEGPVSPPGSATLTLTLEALLAEAPAEREAE